MHTTVKEHIIQLAVSPKVGVAVSAATAGTGVGTIFEMIPDDIGKLATLVSIVLASILIYSHSLTVRSERIKLRRLEAEEVERLAAQKGGSPSGSKGLPGECFDGDSDRSRTTSS